MGSATDEEFFDLVSSAVDARGRAEVATACGASRASVDLWTERRNATHLKPRAWISATIRALLGEQQKDER